MDSTWKQRVVPTDIVGPENKPKSNDAVSASNVDVDPEGWSGKVLLPFRLEVPTLGVQNDLMFIRYVQCTSPLDIMDSLLG